MNSLLDTSHTILVWRKPEDHALSAWKSKLSCAPSTYGGDNWGGPDKTLAKHLLESVTLAPEPTGWLKQDDGQERPCIPFDQYVEVLRRMPKAGRGGAVFNRHFRVGTRKDALRYDEVVPLERFGTAEGGTFLARLGLTPADVEQDRHVHASKGGNAHDEWRLEQIRTVLREAWGNPGMD